MDEARLLLVEDDPISASFLAEALAALPARVDLAVSIAEAIRIAGTATHALWLVDAHLPDGDGLDCLVALRSCAATPALAITAGASRAELDALCAGGFLEVLMKPVSVALLQGTVRRLLGSEAGTSPHQRRPSGKQPVWDEARALAAIGGNAASLAALRRLFLDELPSLRGQLESAQASHDAGAIAAIVHKLRASCGFVGAARLAQAVETLARAPLAPSALREFGFAADDALSSQPAQR